MNKILAITWKELYTTFRNRNLLLLMFATPIVLSTIMGLAFGGLGGDSNSSAFADIPVAIVNLDEGFNLDEQLAADAEASGESFDGQIPSLNELEFEIGGETINVGEQLQLNPNLTITDSDLSADNASFNFGKQLVDILRPQAITTTDSATETTALSINLDDLSCPLLAENDDEEPPFGFEGTLDDLLNTIELDDPEAARAGVENGEYAVAIIIPAGFTNQIMPSFNFGAEGNVEDDTNHVVIEIYGDQGQSISASIVRAIVEGIVNQFARISVTLDAFLNTSFNTIVTQLDLSALDLNNIDLSTLDPTLVTDGLQSLDVSLLEPLGCLILPGAGNIQLTQKPLDESQTRSSFAFIMIILGSGQAMFVAMFTGIFGINSIYEERKNWTLQRLIVSPMPRSFILAGKLLGNVLTITVQLSILFLAFTVITSIVEGTPTFIWGNHVPALLLVTVGISLFVSGLGVLVVGIARTTEQVQIFGPMLASTMGALGGSFGFRLPPSVAQFSPIWWGGEALRTLSNNELDIGLPLLVLFGIGGLLFGVGAILFKQRLDL